MNIKFLLPAVIVVTNLYSCVSERYIYSASAPNNLYFKQKGESELTGFYSTSASNTSNKVFADGLDLNAGYAISDHFAVTAAYFNRKEKDEYNEGYAGPFNSSVFKYKRNLFEIGGGYFMPVNNARTITLNLYTGIATGRFSINDTGTDNYMAAYGRYHTSSISRWFFQPSINFMPGKYVRFSLVLKSSYVHYHHIQTSYTPEELQTFLLNNLDGSTVNFTEPAFDIQFGLPKYPWVKFDFALSNAYRGATYDSQIRRNNSSIGLSFDFSKMVKPNRNL